MNFIKSISEWINNNQGIISLLGLFIVIPFSIFSDKIMNCRKNKRNKTEFVNILVDELFENLKFVSQIKESYEKQIEDNDNWIIPNYLPITHVIGKFFTYELFSALDVKQKKLVSIIYNQLSQLKEEFIFWKGNFEFNTKIRNDKILFKQLYHPITKLVGTSLENMLKLLINLVGEKSIPESTNFDVLSLKNELQKLKKENKSIRLSYNLIKI